MIKHNKQSELRNIFFAYPKVKIFFEYYYHEENLEHIVKATYKMEILDSLNNNAVLFNAC